MPDLERLPTGQYTDDGTHWIMIIIGVVVVFLLIVFFTIYCICRRRRTALFRTVLYGNMVHFNDIDVPLDGDFVNQVNTFNQDDGKPG